MPATEFCHLHVHTQYSLLDGACRIGPMAKKAAELGMPAVAMTDHGNMFGAVKFVDAMRAKGVKPIIGYEGYFTPGDRRLREKAGEDNFHLTLLAANQVGYQNLLKLSSVAYIDGLYYKPRMDWELLSGCAEGLICLSGCLDSRLNRLLLAGARDEARDWLVRMKGLFGPERFYVELQDHGIAEQREVRGPAVELARSLDIPLVATNDCHYLDAADRAWHDVLLCINTRSTLDDPNRFKMSTDQLYFKSAEEMGRVFADVPDALANTVRIAGMCEVKLDRARKYPTFHQEGVPPAENPRLLRSLAEEGLKSRHGELSGPMRERLDYELSVIEQMGYVDYFLIVWDFVRFARESEIPVGLRGSGVGSLVAHALNMTDINPMDYDLLFSRFLDPERKEPPDIDIDLCENRREEVIAYVRRRYGPESTAQIITFGTLQARNCVRDVGRVMGVPLDKVDRLAKMIPEGPKQTLETALAQTPELAALAQEDKQVGQMIEYARRLEGLPRHASTHAAGVVISDRPLWETIPLYRVSDGEVMTQWPMDDLAEVGMLKMDFLGLRTLTIVERARKIIRQEGHEPPPLRVDEMDTDDPLTYQFLSRGQTRGVFQFGSAGIQRLLKRLQPSSIEDIIAAVALYRPGPLQSGMVEDFINRRHGRQAITYPHPAFEPILKPTYGVIVYQEQIMRIANAIAGVSMADAYTMIKAIGKKNEAVIERLHQNFVEGAIKNGLARETAEEIFGLIRHFAGYGFNKAHASAYGFLAFLTAYLEAHYPTEYMAASLSCEMGSTDKVVSLMEECRWLGIEVLPPDINESRSDFTPVGEKRLRFGLGAVKNLGEKAIEAIVAVREAGGPFTSLFDFCERVDQHDVSKGAVEALIMAGCFDALPGDRAQQLAVLETAMKAGARTRRNKLVGQHTLFGAVADADPREKMELNLPDVPPLSAHELAQQEKDALGLYVRYDPLVDYRKRLVRFATAFSSDIEGRPEGEEVVMGGLVESIKRRATRSKEPMAVLRVLDPTNSFECVLFPRAYEHYREMVQPNSVLFFAGRLNHTRGSSLQADEVIAFDDAQARLAESVFVTVPVEGTDAETWAALRAVFERHKGRLPVHVDVVGEGYRLRSRVAGGIGVEASDRLAEEVEAILGPGRITFGVRPNGAHAQRKPRWAKKDGQQ